MQKALRSATPSVCECSSLAFGIPCHREGHRFHHIERCCSRGRREGTLTLEPPLSTSALSATLMATWHSALESRLTSRYTQYT